MFCRSFNVTNNGSNRGESCWNNFCLSGIAYVMCIYFTTLSKLNLSTIVYCPVYFFHFTGIPPHVDTHSAFEDNIVSVTLGSHVRISSVVIP